jgi:rRNA maturation protein Nop10
MARVVKKPIDPVHYGQLAQDLIDLNKEFEITRCGECKRVYAAWRTHCPHCGYVSSLSKPKSEEPFYLKRREM